jgi:hypothetical protein
VNTNTSITNTKTTVNTNPYNNNNNNFNPITGQLAMSNLGYYPTYNNYTRKIFFLNKKIY